MQITVKIESEFLASIIKKSVSLDTDILEHVEPGYFSVDSYQWLVKKLKARNWEPLAYDFVDQLLLEDIKDDEKRNLYRNQIWEIYVRDLTFEKDAIKKFKAFIAFSVVKSTTKSAVDNFERSSRVDYFLQEMNEAQRIAEAVTRDEAFEVSDYALNYEKRTERRTQLRDNPDLNPVIKTGILGLDMQFEIKAPMIVDFFAPFKRYKSIALNHMGYVSLVQGFNVLHVVYENTIELTEDRYDALFAQMSYDRVTAMAIDQGEKDRLDKFFNWVNSWHSRLKILKCTPKATKISDIEEYIEKLKLQESFTPDVVIIDYLNIVKASDACRGEERLQQGQVVWDMKHLADTYNVPIITASQAKMEAVKAERLSQGDRGKSVDISQGVNLSIALDQTPEEKEDDILVFSPLFSREGPIRIPEVVVDTNLNKMMICKEVEALIDLAYKVYSP